jgi:hypothetical protein
LADHHKKNIREEEKVLFTKVSSNKMWHLNLYTSTIKEERVTSLVVVPYMGVNKPLDRTFTVWGWACPVVRVTMMRS